MINSKKSNKALIVKAVQKEQCFKVDARFTFEDILASMEKHPTPFCQIAFDNNLMDICNRIVHDHA